MSTSSDGAGRFSLRGVPAGNVTLQLTSSNASATASLGTVADHDQVDIEIQMNGNQAVVESEEDVGENDDAEVNGLIASISGQTVVVGTTSVQISSSTVIRGNGDHGSGDQTLSATDLKVGERVEVKGTLQGSTVMASEIKVEDNGEAPAPPAGPGEDNEAEAQGVVASMAAGTCATHDLSFLITSGPTVVTTATTRFDDGGCSAIAAGVSVEVKGSESGSTLTATRVKVEKEDGVRVGMVRGK